MVFNITVRNVNYIWILIDTREGHVFLQSRAEYREREITKARQGFLQYFCRIFVGFL